METVVITRFKRVVALYDHVHVSIIEIANKERIFSVLRHFSFLRNNIKMLSGSRLYSIYSKSYREVDQVSEIYEARIYEKIRCHRLQFASGQGTTTHEYY